jgi:hypothetical protein
LHKAIPEKPFNTGLLIIILSVAGYFYVEQPHLTNNYEFPLKVDAYTRGMERFIKLAATKEPVITNKIGGLYLEFSKHHGLEMYRHANIRYIKFENVDVSYQALPYLWEYNTQDRFESFLRDREEALSGEDVKRVWFLVIGLSDFAMNTIYTCDATKEFVDTEFFEDGFLLFSIEARALLDRSIKQREAIETCWKTSQIPGNADLLTTPTVETYSSPHPQ